MLDNQSAADGLVGVTAADKKKLAAVKRNDSAMSNLTLAFATNELISAIIKAQ